MFSKTFFYLSTEFCDALS